MPEPQLEEQISVIDALSQREQDGLGNVCVGFAKAVPPVVLRTLMQKGLIVKCYGGYDVASYWIHFAWCQWCARQPGIDDDTGPRKELEK